MNIVFAGHAGSTQHTLSASDVGRLMKLKPEEIEQLNTLEFEPLVFDRGVPVDIDQADVAQAILGLPGFEEYKEPVVEAAAAPEEKSGDAPASTPARKGSRGSSGEAEGSTGTSTAPNA